MKQKLPLLKTSLSNLYKIFLKIKPLDVCMVIAYVTVFVIMTHKLFPNDFWKTCDIKKGIN